MVNTPSWILFSELSIREQREALQEENPDKLAWVFDLVWDEWYNLVNLENVLCCYPNQLEDWQIVLPEDFSEWNMVILNMWALRKWQVEIIAWEDSNLPEKIQKPVLLSPWVIEYYEGDNWKKYTQTVLRDGGKMNTSEWITTLADANERTTTAGRNFSGDLFEDLEIENAEESPFLMQNESWEYHLVMHDLKYKSHLIASIQNFLENKYLSPEDENYQKVKVSFELKFKGITYEELGAILTTVIENDNFETYSWEDGDIDGIELEKIDLDEELWEFYVFHDKANNTIEYRSIRKITSFPKGLTAIWRVPLRLFLESQNQDPSFKRIDRVWTYGVNLEEWNLRPTKLVPTMDHFSRKVWETV